jgi:acyl-CoA thioesterase
VGPKFLRDTSVEELEPGVYEGRLNRDWWIARGPNGGFLAAIVMRALTAAVGDESRSARSLTIHFTAAPGEGAIRIETELERVGRSLSTVTGRVTQGDRLIALAISAFSTAREGAIEFDDAPAPEAPGPDDAFRVERRPDMPPFSANWDMRVALGGRPFTGEIAEPAVTGGWIRPLEGEVAIDAALLAQLSDAWIPAVFRELEAPNPVPTVDLTVHFRAPLPLPADWTLVRFTTRLARDGFIEEDCEIWSREGRMICQARQLALLQVPSHA